MDIFEIKNTITNFLNPLNIYGYIWIILIFLVEIKFAYKRNDGPLIII